jgi:Type III secretion needle MxiH, YscF, SsaG, EprI, PscF, EscF
MVQRERAPTGLDILNSFWSKQMSIISGILGGGNILGSLLSIASMAFPALQLASSLFNMLGKAVEGAIKGAMDQLMKESGLPKFLGEAIKELASQMLGGNKKSTEAGSDKAMESQYGDVMKAFTEGLTKQLVEDTKDARESESGSGSKGSNSTGGGWLVALAKAFGKIADKAAKELKTAGEGLTSENPSQMIEYQAKAQEFSQMMNTFTNAIKTIGEAEAATVRKG